MDTEQMQDTTKEGAKPELKATETVAPTIEELQKTIEELTRHASNKEQEAARVQKKVEVFENDAKKRLEAQMTKEQLLEKQNAEYKANAERAVAEAKALTEKVAAEAEAKLLKAAFLLKAQNMGFENPADAFLLADRSVIAKKDDGEFDDTSIEGALKPLIGRLPVKAQGDGKGTPKLPPAQSKSKPKEGRAFLKTF